MVDIGKKVKNFKLPATGDREISLNDFKGKNVVLYFYPKDSTPGCTTEGQDFRDAKGKFTIIYSFFIIEVRIFVKPGHSPLCSPDYIICLLQLILYTIS